ncbi:hypothetical protein SPF06_06945 [Sinomonas sp. JGH33]|uniref:Uncharacterized protein n=1 Tax=Sinomonas terricola TaxID=3110330 RepID=A0ABU5T4L6_9MICC|nr:hypothetical protein [Sinomonas sp. JGH33]MEA5454454.1 hypothetical protein [Sinomonas sp. JGH33]
MPHHACRISSCRELVCGDEILAQVGGVVHFRGRVTNLHAPMDLFWAVDAIGERRIIDFHEYAVYLVTEAAEAAQVP